MSKSANGPSNLTEAIDRLENASQSKVQDFKEVLEKDLQYVKKAIDDMKPHFDKLKDNVETEVKKAKSEVEMQVKENPWMAVGIVAIFAFFIGWILGNHKKN
jgi:ElaB/YqjD/DUF883 family membrane-anchored ribosome-binding protein